MGLRRARLAVAAVFGLHAVVFGSWTPHIPLVKDRIGLNEATLGLALLGAPAGSVLAVTIVGGALARWGSRRVVTATMVGYGLSGPLIGLAGSLVELFASLALLGAFMAALDVAMNTKAVAIETAYQRPIMSSFHATWAAAAASGSGVGILAVAWGIGLASQLLVLGSILAIASVVLRTSLLPDPEPVSPEPSAPAASAPNVTEQGAAKPDPMPAPRPAKRTNRAPGGLPWREPRLWVIAAIMFAALLCEGAAADWASVYLRDTIAAPAEMAGLGYTTFAVAMFIGRACGDRWVARYGGHRVVTVLACTGAAAMAATLLIGELWPALIGFALYGLGLSCMVPVSLSSAAATATAAGGHTGHALAAVDGAGRVGFLLGPPAIGALAHATSLPFGLAVLPVLCAGVAVGARSLRPERPAPRAAAPLP